LFFGNCELGDASHIKITSLEDGAYQFLNAVSLKQWQNSSAFFNGDGVVVELYVAPEDEAVFFEVQEVMAGERADRSGKQFQTSNPNEIENVCDGSDDRFSSNEAAVGRLFYINDATGDSVASCTGWIISNGAHLTAGHCVGLMEVLEFNVLESDSDGTINHPDPEDQYPVISGTIRSQDSGFSDWAVFEVSPNSNTGLLPVEAQGAFYRMSKDSSPFELTIIGYGFDGPPPCFGTNQQPGCANQPPPPKNSDSQTQQTASGGNVSEVDTHWEYRVDTEPGNSGSPLIADDITPLTTSTPLTVGIHTDGGCTSGGEGINKGTSFENDALEDAIHTFPEMFSGQNLKYVDNAHPITLEDGTVFRPYDTVTEAINAVASGGLVSIVAGTYSESFTINTAMTLTAPVGAVTIDPTAAFAAQNSDEDTELPLADKDDHSPDGSIPVEYNLSQNYPNPFNPSTTIKFQIPEKGGLKSISTTLRIYDIRGRLVKTLIDENLSPGYHSIHWDGTNERGKKVSSGTYFYTITAGGTFKETKKMLILK
jgi:hypothetical protein